MRNEVHVLFLIDGLELNSVICVLSPARGTPAVEVFLDVMPTETTDLNGGPHISHRRGIGEERGEPDNYKGRA